MESALTLANVVLLLVCIVLSTYHRMLDLLSWHYLLILGVGLGAAAGSFFLADKNAWGLAFACSGGGLILDIVVFMLLDKYRTPESIE